MEKVDVEKVSSFLSEKSWEGKKEHEDETGGELSLSASKVVPQMTQHLSVIMTWDLSGEATRKWAAANRKRLYSARTCHVPLQCAL